MSIIEQAACEKNCLWSKLEFKQRRQCLIKDNNMESGNLFFFPHFLILIFSNGFLSSLPIQILQNQTSVSSGWILPKLRNTKTKTT